MPTYIDVLWKATNDKVNSVHKRALRVLLNGYNSSFEELQHRNEVVEIHEKYLQKHMLEVYRCMSSGKPSFLWEFFNREMIPYSLRINNLLQLPHTRTKIYENESRFRERILWNQLPDLYKAAKTDNEFKIQNRH